ncbi:MAG: methyltransferase domain-containing protein [Proteobacteria bacterium]|nr:methyltransferase domain-containing protein [Pseudomonadota bacterium]
MKTKEQLAAEQSAYWKGPGGTMWLGAYERIQRGITGFSEVALGAANARPGERVLDVGCGTGGTTAELANAVGPNGRVLGVDISEPLVGAARAQGLANAAFEVGDATTYPFEAQAFDLIFSRFGVMFFADPVAAFRNIRRAMKPAGRLVFICWRTPQENPWAAVPMRAAMPFLPPMERPGPEDPGQYSFGDRARVERILGQAGFTGLSIEPVDQMLNQGADIPTVMERIGDFGPLARAFKDVAPEQVAKAKEAIAEALEPHATADGVKLAGACWLVRATLP